MDQVRSTFQFSMLLLLCLSSGTFAAAEGSPLVAALLPLAVFAWLTIERRQGTGIPAGWALFLGCAGAVAAVVEFAWGNIESRLIGPAHLLSYLMAVFILQRKEPRQYWMLLGLSVLQMALASLLTSGAWFGLALVAYVAITLWTMGLFTLYRSLLSVKQTSSSRRDAGVPSTAAARVGAAPSSARNATPLDVDQGLIGWRFLGGAAVMVGLSLLVSTAFFLLTPRVWSSQSRLFDNSRIAGTRPLTGFTEQITLGDMGEILENDDLVMEIELTEPGRPAATTAAEFQSQIGSADPLFRGQVLEIYYGAGWGQIIRKDWSIAQHTTREIPALRQQITLQPIGTSILFGLEPVAACAPVTTREKIYIEQNAGTVRRAIDADIYQEFQYVAFLPRPSGQQSQRIDKNYQVKCGELQGGLERVAELANEIAPGGPRSALTPRERADRLQAYLSDPRRFAYSLDLSIDDPTVDPVVDFLFNRRRGHCEYFASAMALMLRGIGIPSRMASGFKGGEFNPETRKWEVRQLHAHAWTEAYLDGRWQTFDPTPPARDASVARMQQQSIRFWSRWTNRWQQLWNQGVRLSRRDQDRIVYEPIRRGLYEVWESLRDVRGTGSNIVGFFGALSTSPERWVSWRGGTAAFLLLVIVAAFVALFRRLASLARRVSRSAQQARRAAATVAFYERFRRLAAHVGLERTAVQTQQEFARDVKRRLGDAGADVAQVAQRVAEQFYRVRFGEHVISEVELSELQTGLDAFEQQVRRKTPARRAR